MNHQFQEYISSDGELIQLVLFISIFFISWNIENLYGVLFKYKKWKHAFVNAPFIFTNFPGQLLLGVAFVAVIKWTSMHHFGLLYYFHIDKDALLLFLATFILLDLGEYLYHVIMHKVKTLWRFHLVHHSDNTVDISTTLREHPGENIIRLSFTLLWVFLSGAVFWALLLRQIIQVFTTLFAHINYRLPEKLDNAIGFVFITPNLHQVHHHYKQPYTDSNYGDVLSIWDRLFGTLKKLPAEDLVFGLDTHMKKEENAKFKTLFKIPFYKNNQNKIL
jgi:sterol desaturase/sphingolipid hydroxylase (fatty acid hydroxylase superfamily)